MIGKIRFPRHDQWIEAILHENGRWECPAIPCLVRPLDIRFGPAWHEVPAHAAEGLRLFHEAAQWLKGSVFLENTMELTVFTLATVPIINLSA